LKGKRTAPEQIIEKLRMADVELANGQTVGQIVQKLGISEATYYKWRSKYDGMKGSDARRLKEVESENARLKRMVAELMLDNQMLKEVQKKLS